MEARVLAEGKKGRRRVHLVRWALLALGGGVAALGLLAGQEPAGQVRRQPDGSTLELRGWTVPPDHVFVDGKFWQQALLRLPWDVPWVGGFRGRHPSPQDRQIAALFGSYRVFSPTTADDLVLWFRPMGAADLNIRYVPVWLDEHGCRLPVHGENRGFSLNEVRSESETAPGNRARHWHRWKSHVSVLPRREAGPLSYQLIPLVPGKSGSAPITYRIPRPPLPVKYPIWSGAPCPVFANSGGTMFTLAELVRLPVGSAAFEEVAATFRYSGPKAKRQQWRPEQITVSDATGNRVTEAMPDDGGSARLRFPALCRREGAWKLRVRFGPTAPAFVPPDATWTVCKVSSSMYGRQMDPKPSWAGKGVSLQMAELGPPPFVGFGDSPFTLQARLTGSTSVGCKITVMRVTDDTGAVLFDGRASPVRNPERSRDVEPGPVDQWIPVCDNRWADRRLNATFVIHYTPTVEFLVKPP